MQKAIKILRRESARMLLPQAHYGAGGRVLGRPRGLRSPRPISPRAPAGEQHADRAASLPSCPSTGESIRALFSKVDLALDVDQYGEVEGRGGIVRDGLQDDNNPNLP